MGNISWFIVNKVVSCHYYEKQTEIQRLRFFQDLDIFISLRASPMRCAIISSLRARLRETRSEIKPVWNLKPLWKIVPFTLQFHYGQPWDLKPLSKIVSFTSPFHCGNFPKHSRILSHMRKCFLLINASLINAKQMLC